MQKKILFISLLLSLLATYTLAQNKAIINPNGNIIEKLKDDAREVISPSKFMKPLKTNSTTGLPAFLDAPATLDHEVPPDGWVYFGFGPQDVLVQWFECPADLTLEEIGIDLAPPFDEADADYETSTLSMKVVKLNWTKEEILNHPNNPGYLGYYPDNDSYEGIGAFQIDSDGDWVPVNGNTSPFGEDLWSDEGTGFPLTPEGSESEAYQWVDLEILQKPELNQGDIFGVVVKMLGDNINGPMVRMKSVNSLGIPGFKFYQGGRLETDPTSPDYDAGWWIRQYTWDMVAAVTITGDTPPVFTNVTDVPSVMYTTNPIPVEATITDENPDGPDSGVDEAKLLWTTDSSTNMYNEENMINTSGDVYFANIPSQNPGTKVFYKVRATDVNGNSNETAPKEFRTFLPDDPVLVVVNGYSTEQRLQQLIPFYFDVIGVMEEEYDLWYGNNISEELVNNYSTIIEIQMCEGMPAFDNRDVYKNWVAGGEKNFMLCGQEQLGYLYGFQDSTFTAGSFEYDVLGIENSYNDVNYESTGDQEDSSKMIPQFGTMLGDSLAAYMQSLNPSTLLYHPVDILGATNAVNWLDQFVPRDDINSEVFLKGEDVYGLEKPVGHNWTTPNGSKIVFMAFDPLVITQGGDQGTWVATNTVNPFHQAKMWFDLSLTPDPVDWTSSLLVSDAAGKNNSTLTFGQSQNATDGIDENLGEYEMPPPPPTGAFDARFILPNDIASPIDYRHTDVDEAAWEIKFQPSSAGYPMTFTWNPDDLPEGSFYLRDNLGVGLVDVNMKEESSFTLENENLSTLVIEYTEMITMQTEKSEGWNIVSAPLLADDMSVNNIYPSSTSNAFSFNGGYQIVENMEGGDGYWLKFDETAQVSITGLDMGAFSTDLAEGWNIIGPFNNPVPVDDINSSPNGLIASNFFGYVDGYSIPDTLYPSYGYWVKSSGTGTLSYDFAKKGEGQEKSLTQAEAEIVFIVSDGVGGSDTLIVGQDPGATEGLDASLGEVELPPLPPGGVFDARLILPDDTPSPVDIREGGLTFVSSTEFEINWQLGEGSGGFTLEWFLPGEPGEISMTMQDFLGGVVVDEVYDAGVGSYTVTNDNLDALKITFDGIVPVELSSFTANAKSESVHLEWTTASEKNNSGFEIQRSEDNQNFEKVGFVDGNGTTTEKQEYSFTDNSVQSGTYYYRLKQIDLDGSYEYSSVVEVELALPKEFALEQNYPNPFNPSTTIKFALPVEAEVNIILHNALGQKVDNIMNGKLSAGIHTYNFNASRLPSGIYFYSIQAQGVNGTDFFGTKKMMLMK